MLLCKVYIHDESRTPDTPKPRENVQCHRRVAIHHASQVSSCCKSAQGLSISAEDCWPRRDVTAGDLRGAADEVLARSHPDTAGNCEDATKSIA